MISCIVEKCTWNGQSPDLLYGHLRRMPTQLDCFKCNEAACDRTYSLLATFRLHHRKHFIQHPASDANRRKQNVQDPQQNIQLNLTETQEQKINVNDSTTDDMVKSYPEEKSTTFDVDNLSKKMKLLNLGFTLKWLSKDNLPRKIAFAIHKDVETYYIEPFRTALKAASAVEQIGNLTEQILNKKLTIGDESEYMFIQRLKQEDLFCDPTVFTINDELRAEVFQNTQLMVQDKIQGVLMPLKFLLRKYLESPGLFDSVVQNLAPSKDGIYRSLVDGQVWQRRKELFGDKLLIPLNIYFEDFNTSDTSSIHAASTSICGIYFNIPCIPIYLLTKLNNVLIAGFIKTVDRKCNDNDKTFHKLIDILIELETHGLDIVIGNVEKKVCFALGFVLGDNLGINGITGFVESFRATYFCRVCKRTREQTENDSVEQVSSLRKARNYEFDLSLKNVSTTGLKEECIFNRLSYFHVCDNFVFDAMHDMLEGMLVYNLQHCLYYFVFKTLFLTVNDLNRRKNMFVYGDLNSSNILNDFVENKIKKRHIKMTASEMKTFWTFLPLIIGSIIPNDDPVWNFIKTTLKLMHIIFFDRCI
ncbi:uncharacterized protein LOC131686754 [Topomyia yanbarensis]|uniref:uncharacterized protein LOC131686754 n=1 Tax=Topomyia yanbarensis TaxID=2498891 RepID=UPI00273AEC72|nr:uncharacterized protein LOC131686754 [Topomyia yanbarensis]